ncbi:MAG: aminomethyl-transferring glycine dehydrogenase subunit GcvPB [Christensenellales bacterium]|jgi:glycine dehydrogenase subunit 2
MKLIFEKSVPGLGQELLPPLDVPRVKLGETRQSPLPLPQVSESEISRHYTALAKRAHGVNDGFYPLGSCTMKYNPKINDELAGLKGFTGIHPLQEEQYAQGCIEVLATAEKLLCSITGMDAMCFQPAAGSHGEYTGLLLMKAYHLSRGDSKRSKIIIPDSAHGTNPASAAMAGYTVVNIPSAPDGCVDIDKLKEVVGDDTAGLMLTNPNTVGLFDENILTITKIVHDAGGLNYYDGANLNAIMGIARPGDMGFDVIHLNLHKTFSTPHGGGGPGSGPCGCKEFLRPFLPVDMQSESENGFSFATPEKSIGRVRAFYGNFLVTLRALAYILTLGKEGIPEVAKNAVLNANYLMYLLKQNYPLAYDRPCMHEFVLALDSFRKETGVSALDVAKALLDYGIHPPTMYFPLVVPEALMFEPTETETKQTLDGAAEALNEIAKKAKEKPAEVQSAPLLTPVGRLDEVAAARKPRLKYEHSTSA